MGANPMTRGDEIPTEWTMVDRLVPVDLSNIDDKGMKGVVMLGVALGWNLRQVRGAPAQLISRDGLTRNIPTDTGVRQSVFWSLIANIVSHSHGKLPTSELIDLIVKESGMSRAHAQALKSRVTHLSKHDVNTLVIADESDDDELEFMEELPEPELEEAVLQPELVPEAEKPQPEPEASAIALEPQTEVIDGKEYLVRVEPTLNHMGDGNQYLSPLMETVIRQLVDGGDEQITYRCMICGLEYPSKRGVGSHYQRHVQAGEAEPTAAARKIVVNKVEGYTPQEVHLPRQDIRAELRRLRKIVADVQKAVGQDSIKEAERRVMVAERKLADALAENEKLKAANDALEQNLSTVYDLLGELRKPR